MASLRDKILSALDRKTLPINIPEWGGECFVRSWTAKEKNQFLSHFAGVSSSDTGKVFSLNMDVRAVVLSLADKDGNPVLDEKDLDVMLSKNAEVVSRVSQECMLFNGIGNTAELKKT